jgi:hypothetical protein
LPVCRGATSRCGDRPRCAPSRLDPRVAALTARYPAFWSHRDLHRRHRLLSAA